MRAGAIARLPCCTQFWELGHAGLSAALLMHLACKPATVLFCPTAQQPVLLQMQMQVQNMAAAPAISPSAPSIMRHHAAMSHWGSRP